MEECGWNRIGPIRMGGWVSVGGERALEGAWLILDLTGERTEWTERTERRKEGAGRTLLHCTAQLHHRKYCTMPRSTYTSASLSIPSHPTTTTYLSYVYLLVHSLHSLFYFPSMYICTDDPYIHHVPMSLLSSADICTVVSTR